MRPGAHGRKRLAAPAESLRVTCFIAVMGNMGPTVMRMEEPRCRSPSTSALARCCQLLWSASGQAFPAFQTMKPCRPRPGPSTRQPRPSNAHWWAAATRCRAAPAGAWPGLRHRARHAAGRHQRGGGPGVRCPGPCERRCSRRWASNGFDARPGGSICPGWWKKRPPSAPPWGTHRLPERLNSALAGWMGGYRREITHCVN